ncbi:MAG: InlB B-repeat-containing protein [Treponema sp.]|nr:InlB B-repeat-containing protein [Treponema sp.]
MKKLSKVLALLALTCVWGGVTACSNNSDSTPPASPASYKVTFDTDGGTPASIAAQTVTSGAKATKPADPTKDGYGSFDWMNGDSVYDFNAPVTSNLNLKAKWYVGSKKPSVAKSAGDIFFKDGSATAYTAGLTLSDDQKKAAIAVIYKIDGAKAYGVGLVQKQIDNRVKWCLDTANGYNAEITAIQCSCDETTWNVDSVTGDADGSDNFAEIGKALGSYDDTGTLSNYPAFEFAINYKDQKLGAELTSRVAGTAYENGWYLPSAIELVEILKKKDSVNNAINLCGGNIIDCPSGNFYVPSSQLTTYSGKDSYILGVDGSDEFPLHTKKEQGLACAIRVFN